MFNEAYFTEMLRYRGYSGPPVAYRSAVTSPDSTNVGSIGNIAVIDLRDWQSETATGKQSLAVHGRFSNASGATTIWMARCYCSTYGPSESLANTVGVIGVDVVTSIVSASPVTDGTLYWSDELFLDPMGATFVKILQGNVTAGNVTWYVRPI